MQIRRQQQQEHFSSDTYSCQPASQPTNPPANQLRPFYRFLFCLNTSEKITTQSLTTPLTFTITTHTLIQRADIRELARHTPYSRHYTLIFTHKTTQALSHYSSIYTNNHTSSKDCQTQRNIYHSRLTGNKCGKFKR